jgi:hypothetical protein
MNLSAFPALNASLNASSALLLALGYVFIRQRAITAHTLCMLAATATSAVFLVCYLTYHAFHGATHRGRQATIGTRLRHADQARPAIRSTFVLAFVLLLVLLDETQVQGLKLGHFWLRREPR